jgi:phenylalanyl-tRNA synthetase beta chain
MKIPLNWLKEFVSLPTDTRVLTDRLTMIGHMLDKKLEINGQTILDLELRGNRADCYSIYGIAREVSAVFGSKIKPIKTMPFKKVEKLKNSYLKIETPLVKRASMVEIYDVKITPSPMWLKDKIESYGMDSVNNIVDLTNYVMIEMGEPMHAFDLDKVKNKELEIRLAKQGEKITTFQNSVLTLTNQDLVWAMGDYILSVAGAIGEKYNSISDTTKNILLESASYDQANIRQSVYRHNLLTEAGIRHEKFLDPNMVEIAMGRFLYLIDKYRWGKITKEVYDYYPKNTPPWKIELYFSQLSTVSGFEIPKTEIKNIITRLNFNLIKITNESVILEIPTYRTDVKLEEDVIEEILRIYGYDNIAPRALSLEIPPPITPSYIKQELELKEIATAVGFNEAITLSFIKSNYANLNKHPFIAEAKVVSLTNPTSPDNRDMRVTLFPNLIELVQKEIYEREQEVRLFEIGKSYYKSGGKYKEERKIGFAFYSSQNNGFSSFKSLLSTFVTKSGLESIDFKPEALLLNLSSSYEIFLGKELIGFGGNIKNIYYAELNLDLILGKTNNYQVSLWPNYPPQIEDITLNFPASTLIGNALKIILKSSPKIARVELNDVFKDSYTFRIWYQDKTKTMTDSEVETIRKKILENIKDKLGGQVKGN